MNKNSKVLALKYRPQNFFELIGQEVITETGSLDGTGYELDDIEDILNDLDRTSFEVRDYGESSANDDETTVVVKVGRYEQKRNNR